MEPASSIITALGGNVAVARIAGVHRTRPWKWTRPKSEGGTGGIIPFEHVPKLIAAGRAQGIAMTADDFLPESDTIVAGSDTEATSAPAVQNSNSE